MPQIPHCVLLITSSCCALLKISAVTWRLPYFHQCLPTALDAWHHKRSAPIRLLLRTVQRQWPPVVPPITPLEIFHQHLLEDCARWLADCCGLAPRTIAARLGQGRQFLDWLGERGNQERR